MCTVQEVVSNEPLASTSGDAGTEEPAMTLEQFKEQLKELEKGLRSLPATAQVPCALPLPCQPLSCLSSPLHPLQISSGFHLGFCTCIQQAITSQSLCDDTRLQLQRWAA